MTSIAIVGCGPRGLAALEFLLEEYSKRHTIQLSKILIFENAKDLGAGSVWYVDQSDANWINITLRALRELKPRPLITFKNCTIPRFPEFDVWLEREHEIVDNANKDIFLKRSLLGQYLKQRFASIEGPLVSAGLLQIVRQKIYSIDKQDQKIALIDRIGQRYLVDHCLLTVGHQETVLDEQMQKWADHAEKHNLELYKNPYDDEIAKANVRGKVVAIRGMGLSTIDVIRQLTEENGGRYTTMADSNYLQYHDGLATPDKIVPYSLDGLIAAPKPLNVAVDKIYEPDAAAVAGFEQLIIDILNAETSVDSEDFLIEIFADSFANKFTTFYQLSCEELRELVIRYLNDSSSKHPLILDHKVGTVEYMKALCRMSIGRENPSLDYAVGQYWRWLQPSMYKLFSHCSLPDEVMTKIVEVDESTKRFSFGPPVESIYQLIALAEAGILDFSFANDPEITTDVRGWYLRSGESNLLCDVMINSVLASPAVLDVVDGPIYALMKGESIEVVSSALGISTNFDGSVNCASKSVDNIYVLGRNAKGSILGVDALLECFGPRIRAWAIGICDRMSNGQATA